MALNPFLSAMRRLRGIDPERAHRLAILALRLGVVRGTASADDPVLATDVLGLHFANPIGLAAGFDKDAQAIRALRRLGFGAVEAGTVTPQPQPGNPRPRVFRLEDDRAVINRYGFNSQGVAAFAARLARLPRHAGAPLGCNVGPNKGADPAQDIPVLVRAVAPFADYIALNVSSPNTPGLRDQQAPDRLRALLAAARSATAEMPPILVKIAPDQPEGALAEIVEACAEGGADGLIVGNTTVSRPDSLRGAARREAGGLSGEPLFDLSTRVLADAFRLARGRLVLVGCGGVASGRQALAKIKAGASLVQLYTGFAYGGPAVVSDIKRDLAAALRAEGFARVADAVGTAA